MDLRVNICNDQGFLFWLEEWRKMDNIIEEESDLSLFTRGTILMWYIWKARCQTYYNGKPFTNSAILILYNAHLGDLVKMRERPLLTQPENLGFVPPSSLQRTSSVWIKPPHLHIRINTNRAWSPSKAAVGVIDRDEFGSLLVARVLLVKSSSPIESEFKAILEGFRLAKSFILDPIIIESDAKVAIQVLSSDLEPPWSSSLVALDCKTISKSFSSCAWHHIPRSYNRAAHGLAQFALRQNRSFTLSSIPDCILSIILDEM
ncbi:PREDICTED: uncharacterized protein LOC104598689 [Nelumbo nucifera]|uniref:Uncharacterized protein LOC104598689 n=1 Tax=Nelumbo nucifera TaxID=4432 RepID=A0A1U8ABT8_NELNU|nr:PREDICTED: uncharacterized protein LOC104598689 [Nelumbo nucifera]